MVNAFGPTIDTDALVDFMFTARLQDRYHVHRVLAWKDEALFLLRYVMMFWRIIQNDH